MLLLNVLIILWMVYERYYEHISTPEYKHKEFVKHIRSFNYKSIGPVLSEVVEKNCKKFEKKKHWSILKVTSLYSSGLILRNLDDFMQKNAEFLVDIPIAGGDLKRGLIPRHLVKKAMRFHEDDLIFVSYNTFLWNPIESDFFSYTKAFKEDLCWNFIDEIKTPTKEEIEQYKNLYNVKLKEEL